MLSLELLSYWKAEDGSVLLDDSDYEKEFVPGTSGGYHLMMQLNLEVSC